MKPLIFIFVALLLLAGSDDSAAQKRGLVTSSPCPYSCRTQNIPKSHCRDWREGDTCYIEDLSKPPAPVRPAPPPQRPEYERDPDRRYETDGSQECQRNLGSYLARPRISIYQVKRTGNFFGSEYKVQGTIEGVCLVEAGYFERGRRRESIPIQTTRDFRRFDFEVRVRADEDPEIRAYNGNGDSDEVRVTPDREEERPDRRDYEYDRDYYDRRDDSRGW